MRWGVWGNMNEQYSALRSNVSMLGKVLGDTIKDALGENILDRVETIRKLSKSSRAGNEANRQELLTTLQNLSNDELLPVARAFSQFLNLANTAEQYHSISPNGEAASNPEVIAAGIVRLHYISMVYALCGIMDVMVGALRGIGYSVMPMIVSIVGVCVLRLVWLATVFQIPEYHRIETVYLSYPVTWILTSLVYIVFFIWVRVRTCRKSAAA